MAKIKACANQSGEIQGYSFKCPGCGHRHLIYTKEQSPGGPKWGFNGDIDKPTFTPSLMVNRPGEYHVAIYPVCHSFIREGKIQFLSDCTHALAGQTVEMEDI